MRRIGFIIALIAISLLFPNTAMAANDCSATFDPGGRVIRGCIGGFASPDEIKTVTAHFRCVANSNTVDITLGDWKTGLSSPSWCRGSSAFSSNMSNVQIVHDAKGYWACIGAEGLDRAVGKMGVVFRGPSGNVLCTTPEVITKPADWVPVSEGIPGINDAPPDTSQICQAAQGNVDCISCFQKGGIWTAIGCIDTNPNIFIAKLLALGMGIGGGIAFILILFGGLQIMTSAGNPERLNAGRELISSAIIGLLMIIFSVFLLQFIGVNIIGIPRWSG